MDICELYDELEVIKENKYKKLSLVRYIELMHIKFLMAQRFLVVIKLSN